MADDLTFGLRILVNSDEAVDVFKKISSAINDVVASVEEATQQSVMYEGVLFRTSEALQAHINVQREQALAAQSAAKEVKNLGDVTGFTQEQANKLGAETLKQEAALHKAAESAAFNGKEVQALIAKYDPLGATLRSAEADLIRLQKTMGNSERPEIINAFGAIENKITDAKLKIKEAEVAFGAFGTGGAAEFKKVAASAEKGAEGVKANSTVVRESLTLMREASVGNFTRMAGSASIMANAMGLMPVILSPVGLAIAAVAGATLGMVVAFEKGILEQEAMDNALIMTGNYAGATSGSLDVLAHAATASGGSLGEAKKAVEELAGSGKFTSDQIGLISTAAVSMERATGVSVDATIKQFESLAVESTGASARSSSAISNATLKLDDQYHFLTLAVYEQISALEKEGQVKEASALATDEFAKSLKDRSAEIVTNLGYVERGWNAIKDSINGAISAVGDWGKKGAQYNVQDAQSALASFDSTHKAKGDANELVILDERKELVNSLSAAYSELDKEKSKADAEGAKTRATSEAEHAAQMINLTTTQLQRNSQGELTTALKEYHAEVAKISAINPNDPLVAKNAVAAMDEAITKAHTPKQARDMTSRDNNAQLLSDLENYKKAEADKVLAYTSGEKILDASRTAGLVSESDYTATKKQFIAMIEAAQEDALTKEIARRRAQQFTGAAAVSDAKKNATEITKLTEQLAKSKETAKTASDVAGIQETAALAKITHAYQDAQIAAAQYIETVSTKYQRDLNSMGQGNSARAQTSATNAITDKYDAQSQSSEKFKNDNSAGGNFNNTDLKKQYDDQVALTQSSLVQELALYKKYAADKKSQESDMWLGADDAIKNYADTVANTYATVGSLVSSSFKGMEDALVKFVQTGKLSFTSMANSIITDLIRIAVQQNITGPLSGAIKGMFSANANGNAFGSGGVQAFANGAAFTNTIVDSPTAFKFASGSGFNLGVMGEAGPEAVMPLTRGPDGKLGVQSSGSGGGNSVVVNIIESPGNGGQQSKSSSNGVDTLTIMVEKIKNAIAGDIVQGSGAIPSAMSQTYGLNRTAGAY